MRFENFLLNNYIATEEGQRVYRFFEELPERIENGDKDGKIIAFINGLLYQPIAEDFFDIALIAKNIDAIINTTDKADEPVEVSFEDFEAYVQGYLEPVDCSYRDMQGEIPHLSLYFFWVCPEYAFPYFYPIHFNMLQGIFRELAIPVPSLPGIRQHKERCHYYIELCRSLYEFRIKHGITPEELCVVLYGFGKKFVADEILKTLPRPNKAWITGASTGDSIDILPNVTPTSVQWWAAQKNMQAGDIFFMYEVAPHQAIRHIWRAISEAYDDPFQYYSGKIWLSYAQKVPAITYKELTENTIMSQNGLVRAHMQGCGKGPSLTAQEYNALLCMLHTKGFDTSQLPELMAYSLPQQIEINNEQDVERELLEPFLARLGVTEKHITRQMPLRMGRGTRYYPDYVLNAKTTRGEEQGAFVWEAKYRITNNAQMLEALYQAKSYALRLDAKGLGLVSYEGIWLSLANNKFAPDKVEHFSWQALADADTFARVSSLLKKSFGRLL